MTEDKRLDFVLQVNAILTDLQRAMGEGQPHNRTKSRAMDTLSLHFRTLGRVIYLAEELSVLYPGERAFAPDILAVRDVPQLEDDERMAWIVAEEKRGIDLALEVLHKGDRQKDLVENVERFARMGISEYFVYDRTHQELKGYRLVDTGGGRRSSIRSKVHNSSRRYDPIKAQVGVLFSQVLELGLALVNGKLKFFAGATELPTSELLLNRINTMMSNVEKRADLAEQAAKDADQKAKDADQKAQDALEAEQKAKDALLEAEQKAKDALLEAEQKAKDVLEAERLQIVRQLRQTLNTLLRARNLCTPEVQQQVDATSDPQKLQQWLLRSLQASSWDQVLSAPSGVPDR